MRFNNRRLIKPRTKPQGVQHGYIRYVKFDLKGSCTCIRYVSIRKCLYVGTSATVCAPGPFGVMQLKRPPSLASRAVALRSLREPWGLGSKMSIDKAASLGVLGLLAWIRLSGCRESLVDVVWSQFVVVGSKFSLQQPKVFCQGITQTTSPPFSKLSIKWQVAARYREHHAV